MQVSVLLVELFVFGPGYGVFQSTCLCLLRLQFELPLDDSGFLFEGSAGNVGLFNNDGLVLGNGDLVTESDLAGLVLGGGNAQLIFVFGLLLALQQDIGSEFLLLGSLETDAFIAAQ